jgi:hypothetical protein
MPIRELHAMTCWIGVFVFGCGTQSVPRQSTPKPRIEALESDDAEGRLQTAARVRTEREERIALLLRCAESTEGSFTEDSSRALAVELIGYLRAVEAADFLSRNVSLRSGPILRDRNFRGYICAQALIRIGNPTAWDVIQQRLDETLSDTEQRLFAAVLCAIDGDDVAVFRIERELENCQGRPEREANLKEMRESCLRQDFYFVEKIPEEKLPRPRGTAGRKTVLSK